MKKIMVDMDDVICDGGFLKVVNNFLKTDYKLEEIKTYYIQDIIPKEKQKDWEQYFLKQNFYDYCELLPNAYEVMERLNKKYEIYIATAYIFKDNEYYSAECLKHKFNWLYENIPFIKPENFVFLSNKELLDCEIKIDDKLSNLKGKAEKKLLFTAYHNKELSEEEIQKEGVIRVNGWLEVEKLLE